MRSRTLIIFFIVLALIVLSSDFKQSAFAQITYSASFSSTAQAVSSLLKGTKNINLNAYTSSAQATSSPINTKSKQLDRYTSSAKAVSYGYATPPKGTTIPPQQTTSVSGVTVAPIQPINITLGDAFSTNMILIMLVMIPTLIYWLLTRKLIGLLIGLFIGFLAIMSMGITLVGGSTLGSLTFFPLNIVLFIIAFGIIAYAIFYLYHKFFAGE